MEKKKVATLERTQNQRQDVHARQEYYIGRGTSTVQSCKRSCNFGRKIGVQPECMLVAYDMSFFFVFLIGWIFTLIYNRDYVSNNPILVYFGNNNLCIGVDSLPARYFSVPLSGLSVIFFIVTAFLFFKRMWDQDMITETASGKVINRDASKWCRGGLIVAGLPFYLAFGISIGMPPTATGANFKAHLVGFMCGLTGYALLKFSSLVEFFFFRRDVREAKCNGCNNCRSLTFVISEIFHCLLLALFPVSLLTKIIAVYQTPDDELALHVANITFEPTWQQQTGFGLSALLSFACFVCPIVGLFSAPLGRDLYLEFHYDAIHSDSDEMVDYVCCCQFFYSKSHWCFTTFSCCELKGVSPEVHPDTSDTTLPLSRVGTS